MEERVKRILMVDDEEDLQHIVRQNFRRKIRKGEMEFVFAHSGVQALEVLKENCDFDAVFTDINMPEMDGLTLIDNITKYYPDLKTVVVSAYGDMDNVRTAMNNGAFDFITKPIDFEDLEITLEKTAGEVNKIREANINKERLNSLQKEMEIGRRIQNNFLPELIPLIRGWNFSAFSRPAKDVGGDFYDIFNIEGDDKIGLVIADVCGKGVGAALFMALIRSLIRAFTINSDKSAEAVLQIAYNTHNYIIENHESSGMFATMFLSFLDTNTGELTYVNAGHNPPYIKRKDGSFEKLMPYGPALGIFPGPEYKLQKTTLNKGDILVTYTDGVTEASDTEGKLFEESRLKDGLNSDYDSLDKLVENIVADIEVFCKGADQADDITMLLAGRKED